MRGVVTNHRYVTSWGWERADAHKQPCYVEYRYPDFICGLPPCKAVSIHPKIRLICESLITPAVDQGCCIFDFRPSKSLSVATSTFFLLDNPAAKLSCLIELVCSVCEVALYILRQEQLSYPFISLLRGCMVWKKPMGLLKTHNSPHGCLKFWKADTLGIKKESLPSTSNSCVLISI